jgi:hypothetical protein
MNDVLTASLVMRGIERVIISLIGGMCLILAWHIVTKSRQNNGRIDLSDDHWRKIVKRIVSGLVLCSPSIAFALIGCWLLISMMQPVTAIIRESDPLQVAAAQLSGVKGESTSSDRYREYFYQDSGLQRHRCPVPGKR